MKGIESTEQPPLHPACWCFVRVVRRKEARVGPRQAPVVAPQWNGTDFDGAKEEVSTLSEPFNKEIQANNRVQVKVDLNQDLNKRMVARNPEFAAMSESDRELWVRAKVDNWAKTSGDHDSQALAMQIAIKDEFKRAGAELSHLNASTEAMAGAMEIYRKEGQLLRDFSRAQYDATQSWFAARNIEHVTVFRGAVYGPDDVQPNGPGQIGLQPASSFASRLRDALYFSYDGYKPGDTAGGAVHVLRIPASDILSTALTGFGCLNEHELLVLGGVYNGHTMWHEIGAADRKRMQDYAFKYFEELFGGAV